MHEMSKDYKVKPLSGLAPWVGGKRSLAKKIGGIIDSVSHVCYCEPFIGMGGIFFGRQLRPTVEVINDLNGDIVNLFRVVKCHLGAFMETLSLDLQSRQEFHRLLKIPPETMTDIQRAVRFYILQRGRFGGKPKCASFPVTPTKKMGIRPDTMKRFFRQAHLRLAQVTIEKLPYQEVIARYDREKTLFYLDPPYFGCEDYYGPDLFSRADFAKLAKQLGEIKGRFILSINDTPEIRRLFSGFQIQEVSVLYSVNIKRVGELIIQNY